MTNINFKNYSFKDGHFIIKSELLGNLKVRFGVYGDTISSARYLPWNGTGIDEIKHQLKKITNANDELFIYMENLNDKIIIKGVGVGARRGGNCIPLHTIVYTLPNLNQYKTNLCKSYQIISK